LCAATVLMKIGIFLRMLPCSLLDTC